MLNGNKKMGNGKRRAMRMRMRIGGKELIMKYVFCWKKWVLGIEKVRKRNIIKLQSCSSIYIG